MEAESRAMLYFEKLGMENIAWSLRRLHCPVDKNALVLEVGSGGNPYARANVLLDAYEETRERHWVPLKVDRPMVLGFVEKLPFKDHAFDFVIASHVLEHSSDPQRFLSELQRVARGGYVEAPDAFMERINPYRDHRLEVTCRKNKLIIRKKPSWIVEQDIVELYENRAKPFLTGTLIPKHPFAFHVRYYWRNKIDFNIINPEVNAAWEPVPCDRQTPACQGFKGKMRGMFLDFLRYCLSQKTRNNSLELIDLLICPTCGSDVLSTSAEVLICNRCGAVYPVRNGIPVMYPQIDRMK